MIHIYRFCSKLLQFILNILFVIQIALVILVFLTATYWFFDLTGSSSFSFFEPVATYISELVRTFYDRDIEIGGMYIDGTLLMFDILALLVIFIIAKSKYYFHKAIDNVYYLVSDRKKKIEDRFNAQLKQESDEMIKKYTKSALLIKLVARNLQVDAVWGGDSDKGVSEKQEEAFKILYGALKSLPECKFSMAGDKLVVALDNFEKIDNVLYFVEQSVMRINENMKKKSWMINFYIGAEVYQSNANFTKDVYPNLEKLLNLKYQNEILCYGNFNIRYNIKPNPMYAVSLKGKYEINDGSDIYTIIKKN